MLIVKSYNNCNLNKYVYFHHLNFSMFQLSRQRPCSKLGKTPGNISQRQLAKQDKQLLQSVRQLVETGLEHTHEAKFKGGNLDGMNKYNFNLYVPTGKTSKLGMKLHRKLTIDETRLAVRRIDLRDRPFANCSRQQPMKSSESNKAYCDFFGPDLCPGCIQISDQAEFTHKQDKLYPNISVHTGYMIAGGKLTKQKAQASSKGISPFTKQVDPDVLEGVVTDEDIHRRLRQRAVTQHDQLIIVPEEEIMIE